MDLIAIFALYLAWQIVGRWLFAKSCGPRQPHDGRERRESIHLVPPTSNQKG